MLQCRQIALWKLYHLNLCRAQQAPLQSQLRSGGQETSRPQHTLCSAHGNMCGHMLTLAALMARAPLWMMCTFRMPFWLHHPSSSASALLRSLQTFPGYSNTAQDCSACYLCRITSTCVHNFSLFLPMQDAAQFCHQAAWHDSCHPESCSAAPGGAADVCLAT